MKFEVMFLIQPKEALSRLVRSKSSPLGELLAQSTLYRWEEGHPSYPRDDFDREVYVKALYLIALNAEFANDAEFAAFWPDGAPTSITQFDTFWSLRVLGCDDVSGLESEAAANAELVARVANTESVSVNRRLRELAGLA